MSPDAVVASLREEEETTRAGCRGRSKGDWVSAALTVDERADGSAWRFVFRCAGWRSPERLSALRVCANVPCLALPSPALIFFFRVRELVTKSHVAGAYSIWLRS